VKEHYQQNDIQKANLGIYEGKAAWEVVTKTENGSFNYYLLAFETGEEINTILGI